jgi:hypothetical protein
LSFSSLEFSLDRVGRQIPLLRRSWCPLLARNARNGAPSCPLLSTGFVLIERGGQECPPHISSSVIR